MTKNQVKILVVDDETDLLNSLKQILSDELQCEVLVATNAADGMAKTLEERPTLIISDYYMPGEDGFSFCKKMKSDPELSTIPFLILTSASEITNLVRGLETGADDYITKPFHVEELLSRVRAHLRVNALQEELKQDKLELKRLNEELEESLYGVIELLTQLIGLRIPNAVARGRRAANIAEWVGIRMGMGETLLYHTVVAARLHEIGKISIADQILRKEPQTIDESDMKTLRQFPVFGHLIVSTVPQLRPVAKYIRWQMENFDGTGFPDHLQNEEIPLPSRILRGINLAESLSMQPSNTRETMIEEIQKCRSTLLDPRVCQLLVEYLRNVDSTEWKETMQQVGVFELQEGMVIAEDIYTGSGVKLLNKDSVITMQTIERLLSHHNADPILNTIYIYKEKM